MSHAVSEKKASALRVLNIPRYSRVPFKDLQNDPHLPPDNRSRTYSVTSRIAITSAKLPSSDTHQSPTSTTVSQQSVIAFSAPPTSPAKRAKVEEIISKPGIAAGRGHVRFRHRMTTFNGIMFLPAIPLFEASPMTASQSLAFPRSRGLPQASSIVGSESVDRLKESIFSACHGPSSSSDSLAIIRRDDGDQAPGKSRPVNYRDVHSSPAFSRRGIIPSSAPQTNHVSPVHVRVAQEHLPEHSSMLLDRPTLASPPVSAMQLHNPTIGFPTDMLNMLGSLETIASKVKTLDVPNDMLKPECARDWDHNVQSPITGQRIHEHGDMQANDLASINGRWNTFEKGKWRATRSAVLNHSETSVLAGSDRLHHDLLKLTTPQHPNTDWYPYDPYNAPEFLAGCSTLPVIFRAHGYHSKPAFSRQRSPGPRKLSLPSGLPPRRRASAGHFKLSHLHSERPTPPPPMPPVVQLQSPPSKSSTFKSLLQRSRPRARTPKANASSIPLSRRPVENIPIRLPKPRFLWLKI